MTQCCNQHLKAPNNNISRHKNWFWVSGNPFQFSFLKPKNNFWFTGIIIGCHIYQNIIYYKGALKEHLFWVALYKFWRSGVPIRDSSSRRITNLCNLSRILDEAKKWLFKAKVFDLEAIKLTHSNQCHLVDRAVICISWHHNTRHIGPLVVNFIGIPILLQSSH